MVSAPAFVQRITAHYQLDPGIVTLVLVFVILLPLSTPRIYATDEVQYYAYLRSLYFDRDLDFRNEYEHFAAIGQQHNDPAIYNALLRDHPSDPVTNPQTGLLRNVAPIGAALLWSPGFLLADVLVHVTNLSGAQIPTDGFSRPYIWSVCFMSALYALLGLVLTYRLARHLGHVFAATLATMSVWLASPLVFYTYIAMPWSHTPAFFLVALFLTLWLRDWHSPLAQQHAQRRLHRWALMGLVGGLMTSTREQLGLLLLMPAVEGLVAYGYMLFSRIPARRPTTDLAPQPLAPLKTLFIGHCVFLVCLILALTPQLITYQVLNGHPFPSTTVADKIGSARGFSPHFFDTLFHLEHGAFLWSPILLVGLMGLFSLGRRDWLLALLLTLGFIGQTYINGAFGSTWHLSGAFGFRRLIECTPIFVLGLTSLLEWLRKRTGPVPLLLVASFLIYWNIGLIAQWTVVRPAMRPGLIWDHMLYSQFVEVPRQVAGQFFQLLFNRCRIVNNQNC